MTNSSGKKVTSGLTWKLLERFGAQGVTFVVSLILARVLDPDTYGTIALITVITTILQVFVDSGLGTALVQKKEADDVDFSSVFYFNIVLSIILYVVLFVLSPWISRLYKIPELTPQIRVLGLVVVVAGAKNILQAYVSRHLLFKKFFFATLGGTVGAAFIGIWMAYHGFGAWALIAQTLFNTTVDTIILWLTVKWYPKREFSLSRLKVLFSFGWKLLVSTLLDKIWIQLRQLIIGVKYSTEDLAYYNKGNEFPQEATTAINSSIDSVLLPVMSQAQDSRESVKNMTRKAIRISSFVMWPVMIGLAAVAEPMIRLLVTEKWMPAVPYLRIMCLTFAFYPIHTANLNAIKALGRSDLFLGLEVAKKIVNLVLILISMRISVYAMALSAIVGSFFCQIINSWPNKKLLRYTYFEQLRDILPSVIMSFCMGIVVYGVQFFGLRDIFTLIIQIFSGVIVYAFLSVITKYEPFYYCLSIVKDVLFSRRRHSNC